jgi:hypothetical protein
MPFLSSNINTAIVMTQFDLRGFWHPLGFRVEKNTPKNLDAITCNLAGFAAGLGEEKRECTDKNFPGYHSSSFEDYLAMCKRLAKCCNRVQKEAIQLIIQEIVKQHEDMEAEVATGKVKQHSSYLNPLRKDNRWGKAVIALAKAFKVTLKK